MKKLFLLFQILICTFGISQIPKKQIGTSVWIKDGKTLADSVITHIITYDSLGHKTTESKIFKNENGEYLDSNYLVYDHSERTLYQFVGGEHWYYKYDDLGTITEVKAYRANDTLINIFTPKYKDGKLSELSVEYNGSVSVRTYTYEKRTVIVDYGGLLTTIEKRDKNGALIYYKSIMKHTGKHIIEIHTITRNSSGSVTSFKKEIDGKVIKLTIHQYENGLEQTRTEQYYNPDYTVVTTYQYEY